MKKIIVLGLLAIASAFAQMNTLTQTTLSAASVAGQGVYQVTSATGITGSTSFGSPQSMLYIIDPGSRKGEAVLVISVTGTTVVGQPTSGGQGQAHVSGAIVLIGLPNWFNGYDPNGACTTASTYVTPWVNTATGNQWLCSTLTLTWVPGWQNITAPAGVTTAVASVAGATLPSGPIFHMTGTNAITSFTLPVGFAGGPFCIIPDAAYTTTATNNIGTASTGVANKVQCWQYDVKNAKFYSSY